MSSNPTDDFLGDSLAARLLRRVPGVSFAERQARRVERRVLQEFKARLDRAGDDAYSTIAKAGVYADPAGDSIRDLQVRLGKLLAATQDMSHHDALNAYYGSVLRAMVPDESRILATLSDGTRYPLVNVVVAVRMGMSGSRTVLDNISNVGRAAGVLALELTPNYIQRLRVFGLVQVEAEVEEQGVQYELLETDALVRATLEKLSKSGRNGQVARRSLGVSPLGRALWAACHADEQA